MGATWRIIYGYFWLYRINSKADVERRLDSGKWKPVKAFNDLRARKLKVHMKRADGKFINVCVKHLMRDCFLGGRRPGKVVGFRNGMYTDCCVENLYFTTRTDVGKRLGGSGRRAIEKVDSEGNVVAIYASVSEAAKKNFTSRKAIWLRCKKKVKDPFSLDGFNYRYER